MKRHEGPAWFSSCNVLTYTPNVHRLVSSISGLSFSKPQRGNWVIIQQRNKKKEGPVPVINTRHVRGRALGSAGMDFWCSQPGPDCSWSLGGFGWLFYFILFFKGFSTEASGLKTFVPPPPPSLLHVVLLSSLAKLNSASGHLLSLAFIFFFSEGLFSVQLLFGEMSRACEVIPGQSLSVLHFYLLHPIFKDWVSGWAR